MKRSRALAAGLLATLGAAGWLALQEGPASDDVEPAAAVQRAPGVDRAARAHRAAPAAAVAASAWPQPPAMRASEPWPFDPTRARAWLPPAPPVALAPVPSTPAATAAAPIPPVPQAPAFPYAWIGRIEEGGQASALLSGPLQTLGVKALDVIDGQWRVDDVRAQSLTVTWLPGGQRQTLAFPAS